MNKYEIFSQLHKQRAPFLLGNCWDVNSAILLEKAGCVAVATSSHAFAAAAGYEDGEQVSFQLLLQSVKRIAGAVSIPFSVDLEGGYSRSVTGIIEHIEKLNDAGVAGVNLEDTIAGTTRLLQPATAFQKTIDEIANHISRNNLHIFLNIRTDGFLLGMSTALDETLQRVKRYQNAGANGIFVPCITSSNDIAAVVNSTTLPVNVMCMPALPAFNELEQLGVKRISMGPFFYNKIYDGITALFTSINNASGFSPIFL